MSRRPREAAQQPGRGGEGWRLRWSESAIPRQAFRRPRLLVAASAPVGAAWNKTGDFSLGVAGVGETTIDVAYDAVDQPDGVPITAGEEVLVFAVGINTGWAAPAGWSVAGSGSHDELDWMVATRRITGTESTTFSMPDMSPGWTEGPGDKGTWTIMWWRFSTASVGGQWHATASGTSGGTSREWWMPSTSWWTNAYTNYYAWNVGVALPIDTTDDIAYSNSFSGAADVTWVYGDTRRMFGFYMGESYTPFEAPDELSESSASTSGSRWLMVGMGWTP